MTKIWRPDEAGIIEFLNGINTGALGTVSRAGRPNVSTVAFSAHPRLRILFGTASTSRKAKNISRNLNVALTVTDVGRRLTVQFEGVAFQASVHQYARLREAHYAKLPGSKQFEDVPGQVFFIVRPQLVRATDCNPDPWVTTQLNFDRAELNV